MFDFSNRRFSPRTVLSQFVCSSRICQVCPGSTSGRVQNEDCISHRVLRTGSSRYRDEQARSTALFRLIRTSWPAMSLVSSPIFKTRWVAVVSTSSIMVAQAQAQSTLRTYSGYRFDRPLSIKYSLILCLPFDRIGARHPGMTHIPRTRFPALVTHLHSQNI